VATVSFPVSFPPIHASFTFFGGITFKGNQCLHYGFLWGLNCQLSFQKNCLNLHRFWLQGVLQLRAELLRTPFCNSPTKLCRLGYKPDLIDLNPAVLGIMGQEILTGILGIIEKKDISFSPVLMNWGLPKFLLCCKQTKVPFITLTRNKFHN
jgi:hypothetical protein